MTRTLTAYINVESLGLQSKISVIGTYSNVKILNLFQHNMTV